MADYILNGTIKLKDQTKQALGDAEKNVSGFQKAVNIANTALKAFATVETVKAVAELTELGAQSNAVEKRFIALAGGAEQAERYLRAIRTETGNTIDEMTAMAAASKYMTLGLADSADSAARLIGMAVALGDQTASTQQRVDDFGALLANQSIPRLDNFGISSAKVRERIRELQEAFPGMSREVAFNQAVMEEGAIAMERLGDAADNQAATLARAEVIWKNFKTTAATFVADAIVPAVEGFNDLVNFSQNVDDALADNTDSAIEAGDAWEDYARKQLEAQITAGNAADIMLEVNAAMQRVGETTALNGVVQLENNEIVEEAIRLGVGYGETLDKVSYEAIIAGNQAASEGYNDVGVGAFRAAQEVEAYKIAQEAAATAAAEASVSFNNAAAALGDMSIAQLVSAQIRVLEESMKAGEISAQEFADAQFALLTQSGLLTTAEMNAQTTIDTLTAAFTSGKISADSYAQGVLAAKAAVEALDGTTATVTVNYNIPSLPKSGPIEQDPVAFARGGTVQTNSPVLVGEAGPELLYGAKGARVIDSSRTQNITNNYGGISVNTSLGLERLISESRRARMMNVRL